MMAGYLKGQRLSDPGTCCLLNCAKGQHMVLIQLVVIFQGCISLLSNPTYELCPFCNCFSEVYLVKIFPSQGRICVIFIIISSVLIAILVFFFLRKNMLLKQNHISINLIILKYHSVELSTLIVLCSCYTCPVPKHFHHPKGKPYSILNHYLFHTPSAPGNHQFASISMHLTIQDISIESYTV